MAEVRRTQDAFQNENSGLFSCYSISVANTASYSVAALDICSVSHFFDLLAFPYWILRGPFIQAKERFQADEGMAPTTIVLEKYVCSNCFSY